MCLTCKKQIVIKPVTKSKIVYKVLRCTGNGEYYTPIVDVKIDINKILYAQEGINVWHQLTERYPVSEFRIDKGLVHCFLYKLKAIEYAQTLLDVQPNSRFHVFKCIIPTKGWYVKGNDGDIGTNMVKFQEVIRKLDNYSKYENV